METFEFVVTSIARVALKRACKRFRQKVSRMPLLE